MTSPMHAVAGPPDREEETLRAQAADPAPAPSRPSELLTLAAWFGLAGGFLDLAALLIKKNLIYGYIFYYQDRHFAWTVPVATLLLVMLPGLALAALAWLRPGWIRREGALWLFAALALVEPLLRMPLDAVAAVLLAAGVGRLVGRWMTARFARLLAPSLVVLVVALGLIVAATEGRRAWAEHRARAGQPPAPAGAPNVLLIVLDAVRAENLSLYGYGRDTTPNLVRWAAKGVRFDRAIAPASWTFPSHASLFTGRWPYQLDTDWKSALDATAPTLAGFLTAQGYRTAGFVANTEFCSYETGLDRGFLSFEDYIPPPEAIPDSSMVGSRLSQALTGSRDGYARKWLRFRSHDAPGINRAFLDWLDRPSRPERPFFAFLNYMDAHEPFVTPSGSKHHFGSRPESAADVELLLDWWNRDKLRLSSREIALARDGYDDCIAHLDHWIGRLLDELDRRGVLGRTLVIITADHGERLGEDGVFNHGTELSMHEVHVPLLILSPSAPAGRRVSRAVSLRDVPATVADVLGLGGRSPFPGRSLAALWRSESGSGRPAAPPVLSEVEGPERRVLHIGRELPLKGWMMSLVADGKHYIRDQHGTEELYDLDADPAEATNLANSTDGLPALKTFRRKLLDALDAEPPLDGTGPEWLRSYKYYLRLMAE